MAMGLRMLNNYRADQLAYEGLGDVEAISEMGFDLKLLVQGPPEDRFRTRFQETFDQLGCTLEFDIFPEPWGLSKRLKEGDSMRPISRITAAWRHERPRYRWWLVES